MKNTRGQTALILILLTAAALIFLAITLNWGRVSQTKILLSTSAYQSASLLGSDAASYGEENKEQYLNDVNSVTGLAAWIMAIITLGLALVNLVIKLITGNIAGAILAIVSAVMAVVNLVLQLTIIGPQTTTLWNTAQKNQPVQQQFFEQGISTALQGAVNDQVNITDYFDANANGAFGNSAAGTPNDIIGRFAFFYGERQKMIAQPLNPQLVNFFNSLEAFMNGGTTPGGTTYSVPLNDKCPDADGVPGNSAYTPYCDPCCQPANVLDPDYSSSTPNPLHPNQYKTIRPSNCPTDTSANGAPAQCWTNNPYNTAPGSNDSPYTLLYDPAYQQFLTSGGSLLDQFGRDEQEFPFYSQVGVYPYMTPKGGIFPNGIFPFFWLMKDYSPEVDNISPTGLLPSQWHWCTVPPATNLTATPLPEPPWPGDPSTSYPPNGFADLTQLSLSYGCSGPDCCVNYLPNWIVPGTSAPNNTCPGTSGATIDEVGNSSLAGLVYQGNGNNSTANPALDTSFGEANSTSCTGTATGNPSGQCSWMEGDDQLCSNPPPAVPVTTSPWDYPYNGAVTMPNLPDGMCEWTGPDIPPATDSTAAAQATLPPGPPFALTWPASLTPNNPPPTSSVDALDDAMHTLTDFDDFAQSFLAQPLGILNATFDSWYPQAATWIAPECTNPFCDLDTSTECTQNPGNPVCKAATTSCTDHTCNPGSNGRLLSIYDPAPYPELPGSGFSNTNPPAVDEFGNWNTNVITPWINNNYTSTAWCVPQQGTLVSPIQSLLSGGIGPTVPGVQASTETAYIASAGPWGTMPSILACMAYNGSGGAGNIGLNTTIDASSGGISGLTGTSGQTGGNVSTGGAIFNYQQCLNALTTPIDSKGDTVCTGYEFPPLPAACNPSILGRDLLYGAVPQFRGSGTSGLIVNPPVCVCAGGTSNPYGCADGTSGGCTINTAAQTCGTCAATPTPPACIVKTVSSPPPVTCANADSPPNPTQQTNYSTNWECLDTNYCQCLESSYTNDTDGGGCNTAIPGGYAAWVQNSLNLFKDEAPKFDLRASFLSDVYNRAQAMSNLFSAGSTELAKFLAPCAGGPTCSNGGPAAQLMYARSLPGLGTQPIPNSVIYGWIDKTLANGLTLPPANGNPGGTGYAHIVKVTAYAPGRNVTPTGLTASFIQALLPWVKTFSHAFTRTYELTNRDGYVYVSIKRWDEDHSNPVNFPNGHLLWQSLFHNPAATQLNTSGITIGNGSLGPCAALYPSGSSDTFGWGLEPLTSLGLQAPYASISQTDSTALAQAFMLNDEGDGKTDPSAGDGTACAAGISSPYCSCLAQADQLLATAPESHACVDYIASTNATDSDTQNPQNTNSGAHDRDYTLKFVDCSTIAGYPPPDDLTAPSSNNQTGASS